MIKINFGCFNTNHPDWIGVDHSFKHIIIDRIPFSEKVLFKLGILNKEQFLWHKNRDFKNVRYGDATKKLKFPDNHADFIYSSHMIEHLYRDDAIFFIKECYRIAKKGARIRYCLPSWEMARKNSSMDIHFAKNKKELKYSHKWLWSIPELQEVLKKVGFINVIEKEFGEGDFPELSSLETKKGLCLEANK